MDKTYCYPGTDVLKNRLNIRDENRLLDAEIKLVSVRLYQLQEKPIRGKFDFEHLCSIHKHIFQDIYSWAGKIRTVDIAKGSSLFCPAWNIHGYAGSVFQRFYKSCMDARNNPEKFIKIFAAYYADLNALHPFREGNGRSQREFARELCLQCGYTFDLRYTDHEEMVDASIDSMERCEYAKLETIFHKCIMPLSVFP